VETKPSHTNAQGRVAEFDDSEVFAAALQKVDIEVLQTGQGIFKATLAAFSTGLCDVQIGSINQPIIARGGTRRARLGLLLEMRKREWSCFGQSMGDASAALYTGGCELLLKASPGTQWAFISVAPEVLAQSALDLYGREPRLPQRGFEVVRPDPAELEGICALLAESVMTVATGPTALQTGFKLVMDGALRRSMVRMLLEGRASEVATGKILFFRRVLGRVEGFQAANLERTIQLEELCKATGLSKQSLEETFHEYLGVGPIRYLKIRHLYHVYRALLRADPATTAVADVARAWGFYHQGRLNAEFTALFGKSPLEVLRQPGVRFP
jgi:AraC-like DNA-binding protein